MDRPFRLESRTNAQDIVSLTIRYVNMHKDCYSID